MQWVSEALGRVRESLWLTQKPETRRERSSEFAPWLSNAMERYRLKSQNQSYILTILRTMSFLLASSMLSSVISQGSSINCGPCSSPIVPFPNSLQPLTGCPTLPSHSFTSLHVFHSDPKLSCILTESHTLSCRHRTGLCCQTSPSEISKGGGLFPLVFLTKPTSASHDALFGAPDSCIP